MHRLLQRVGSGASTLLRGGSTTFGCLGQLRGITGTPASPAITNIDSRNEIGEELDFVNYFVAQASSVKQLLKQPKNVNYIH